jgi:hypothetical protein
MTKVIKILRIAYKFRNPLGCEDDEQGRILGPFLYGSAMLEGLYY